MMINFEQIAELLQATGLDKHVVQAMVSVGKVREQKLRRQQSTIGSQLSLVHDLLTPAECVQDLIMERLIDKGFRPGQFTWIGSETAPEYTDDPRVVVALEVTLGDLASTVRFAYQWASEGKPGARLGPVSLSKKNLRLLPNSEVFRPFTIQWRRLKLEDHSNKTLSDATMPENRLGIAALFAAAQHPSLVMVEQNREAVWALPGFYHYRGFPYEARSISVCFQQKGTKMILLDWDEDIVHKRLVIPHLA